ncbi:MAG: 3-dehydroquinate dehydratase [Kiritimatiellae bacterium]|nr:3-dehydroquinate dehydratase [Kiritimatiellia bacterium]
MKILVLNGPNLNLLGTREPDIYGHDSYDSLVALLAARARELDVDLACFQSNHEGALVDAIQQAWRDGVDGLLLNPAAYTHTSVAIPDALRAVRLPAVEVHISDPDAREPFRRVNLIRSACVATVSGHGLHGYLEALDLLVARLRDPAHPEP